MLKSIIYQDIYQNGIRVGDWLIREEEGSCQGALVFRDLVALQQGQDRRYAMLPNKYVNL